MKTTRNSLLLEIIALLSRYSYTEWLQLADFIESDRTRAAIILFLREMGTLNHAPGKAEPVSFKSHERRRRDKKSKDSTAKERLELELSHNSISELRTMAQQVGVQFVPKDSKQRLIRRLILRTMKDGRAKKNLPLENQNRDYGRWADIILGRGRKPDRSQT